MMILEVEWMTNRTDRYVHGRFNFFSFLVCSYLVSIFDLALFCLDLPLPQAGTKKYPRQRHPIGEKSQDKKMPA